MKKDYLVRLDKAIRTPEQNERVYERMLRLILLDGNASVDERLIDHYLSLIEETKRGIKS